MTQLAKARKQGRQGQTGQIASMDFDSTIQAFDLGCRGAAAAMTLLVAGLLVRQHGRAWAARLGAAFAVGVAFYALCSKPGFVAHLSAWQAPILAVCAGNSVVFWLFARAVFDDGFEPRWRHAAVWAVLAGLGLLEFLVLVPARSPAAVPLGAALSLASLGFAILAVVQTVSGWRADLIEGRRRLRALVVSGVAGYIAIVGTAELLLRGRPPPLTAAALNAAGLAAASALIAWSLLRVAGKDLFPEPPAALSPPAASVAPKKPRELEGEAPDPKALAALDRLMAVERIYRQEGLSIGILAAKLKLPEYRLRRLINQRLGHRNFNAYLNHYRVEDAKVGLADPAQAEVPILTIAMDAGFQSLRAFNRAFRTETGITPSEYREHARARTAS
jgi:AraC-like DNA-binding protein